jgi:hypothetical protein
MFEATEQLQENHERDCFLNGQIPTYGTIVQNSQKPNQDLYNSINHT